MISRGEWRRCSKVGGSAPRSEESILVIFSHNSWVVEVARVLASILHSGVLGERQDQDSKFRRVPTFKQAWTSHSTKQLVVQKSNSVTEE